MYDCVEPWIVEDSGIPFQKQNNFFLKMAHVYSSGVD